MWHVAKMIYAWLCHGRKSIGCGVGRPSSSSGSDSDVTCHWAACVTSEGHIRLLIDETGLETWLW